MNGLVTDLLAFMEPVKVLAPRLVSLIHQGSTPMATGLWHSVHQVLSVKAEPTPDYGDHGR